LVLFYTGMIGTVIMPIINFTVGMMVG
jgi:hypothetical protein